MSSTVILVGADCPPLSLHARAFREAGLKVAHASSGADIKRFFDIQSPDAVLLDAGVTPALSADVWRILDQPTPAPRVVVFGDFNNETARTNAREHSAVCLAPQSEEDLVQAVQELVARYQKAKEETQRLHSTLSANMRDFKMSFRRILEPRHASELDKGVVVLVAEDEECVRRFLTITLERSGYLVLEAIDGQEAIRNLWNYADAVRLVILDWSMPGLAGLDIVRTMRKVSPDARLLICSGSSEGMIRSALAGEPVEGVLEKPFLAVELLEEVQRQMHLARFANSPQARSAGRHHL